MPSNISPNSQAVAPYRSRTNAKQGFTLVELSIVLVIIGLLLGGVLVGKEMIRAAQLRSVITDAQNYLAASRLFQDKYQCIPGDCLNASTYMNAVTNGNGNGRIDVASAANGPGEIYGVWQHLASAGYISGSYSGNSGPGGTSDSIIGTNSPASRVPLAGFTLGWAPAYASDPNHYDANAGNMLTFGAKYPASSTYAMVLTPAEAYSIDRKIDDGIPGTGSILALYGNFYASGCNTSGSVNTNPSVSAYNTSNTGIACQLIFITGW